MAQAPTTWLPRIATVYRAIVFPKTIVPYIFTDSIFYNPHFTEPGHITADNIRTCKQTS